MKFDRIKIKHTHPNVQNYLKKQHNHDAQTDTESMFLRNCTYDLFLYLYRYRKIKDTAFNGEKVKAYDWINDCPTDEFLIILATERI